VKKWLSLGGAVLAEVSATLALKAAIETPGWYVLVVGGYIAAFGLLTICLRLGMTISVAYGAWGAGGVTTTALLSALIFNETLTLLMGLGMIVILAGVVTVELGSQSAKRLQHAKDAK
jgi:small multidrug resistance pump